MPVLIVTGYPCAGKSRLVEFICQRVRQHHRTVKVAVISDASACPDLHTACDCYATPLAEKRTRAALKASLDRAVASIVPTSGNTLVIVDSLNYVKGYRYELYCISKAHAQVHAVLWVPTSEHIVRQRNNAGRYYPDALLDELLQRYEPPSAQHRWETPLFQISTDDSVASLSQNGATNAATAFTTASSTVYNMHSTAAGTRSTTPPPTPNQSVTAPTKPVISKSAASTFRRTAKKASSDCCHDVAPAKEAPAAAAQSVEQPTTASMTSTNSNGGTPTSSVAPPPPPPPPPPLENQVDAMLQALLVSAQPLRQGISTRTHTATDGNVLHDIDHITLRLQQLILQQQQQQAADQDHLQLLVALSPGDVPLPLEVTNVVTAPQLASMRQQYLAWIRTYPPTDASDHGVARSFIDYIQAHQYSSE